MYTYIHIYIYTNLATAASAGKSTIRNPKGAPRVRVRGRVRVKGQVSGFGVR